MNPDKLPVSILLVDDDEFSLEFIGDMLRSIGVREIRAVLSVPKALEALAESEPEVMICDLNMPGMDGIELLRHAAAAGFCGGVILLSGVDGKLLQAAENLALAHRLRVLGALAKPVDEAQLAALLQRFGGEETAPAPAAAFVELTADELTSGLASDCLQLFVQPKVNALDRQVVGVECLARWQHPQRGVLPPAAFIGAAEACGMIDALTYDILHMASILLKEWRRAGLPLTVSVNISMDSLQVLDLPEVFADIVTRAGLAPADLTLEMSESRLLTDPTVSLDILTRLRLKGFGLSIDDFGLAYSALDKLKQLPFSELKIDRRFVSGAAGDASARAILESSIRLGHGLKLRVVAEGVETPEEWTLVSRVGCDEVQGYAIARPMPAAAFPAWLACWQRDNPLAESAVVSSDSVDGASGGHLLVVDDDVFALDLYADTLAHRFRVSTARSGADALALVERETPDLIVLDVDMPGMDGYETCRRLRSREATATTPIVFISAHDRIEDRLAAYEAGGNDYLLKPCATGEILAKSARLIEAAAAHRDAREMASYASRAAMTAMSSLGEMGALVQSLQRFNACSDYAALCQAVLDGIATFGLQGAVRISAGGEVRVCNSKGDRNPLEASIIENMAAMDRISQFKNRMSIRYEHVSLLVTNMPLDDAEQCGRLRDHLAMLIESADVRARTILGVIQAQRQTVGIERTIEAIAATLVGIDQAQRNSRIGTSLAVQHLNETVSRALISMSLSDAHEALMLRVVAEGVEQILDAQSSETDLQDRFTGVLAQLKSLLSQTP